MFERFMMKVYPDTPYGMFLIRLFTIMNAPPIHGNVEVEIAPVDFVRPTELNIEMYHHFLTKGDNKPISDAACSPHKGKTVSAYISAVQVTCDKLSGFNQSITDKETADAIRSQIDDGNSQPNR
jgi:hypothetical protein